MIKCKGFGKMRSWPIRCNKLLFDGRAEENRQQTVDMLAGIPAQF